MSTQVTMGLQMLGAPAPGAAEASGSSNAREPLINEVGEWNREGPVRNFVFKA